MAMQSLTQLYKIGRGPSSSHTMGPEKACRIFKETYSHADRIRAVLYGSLSLTGKGHGTDKVIEKTLFPIETEIVFDNTDVLQKHPNTMRLYAYRNGEEIGTMTVYSVGGGEIVIEGMTLPEAKDVYAMASFSEIAAYCKKKNIRLWEFVKENEGEEIFAFLSSVPWFKTRIADLRSP